MTARLFADDCLLYRKVVNTDGDLSDLQQDLDQVQADEIQDGQVWGYRSHKQA